MMIVVTYCVCLLVITDMIILIYRKSLKTCLQTHWTSLHVPYIFVDCCMHNLHIFMYNNIPCIIFLILVLLV